MSKQKRRYEPEFKALVVKKLLTGEETLNQLARQHGIAPGTLSRWYQEFQENLPSIFGRIDKTKDEKIDRLERELKASQEKIGQLTIERDWLEKKSDEVFGPNGPHRTRFGRK